MKMFSDKYKEYAKINVENLPDFPEENFISSLVTKMQKDIEDMYYEFLTIHNIFVNSIIDNIKLNKDSKFSFFIKFFKHSI